MVLRGELITEIRCAVRDRLDSHGECPICGFIGGFRGYGAPMRVSAQCPNCGSLERHRLLALAINRKQLSLQGTSILHFAPEPELRTVIEGQKPELYHRSSYPAVDGFDFNINLENIELSDCIYDIVICNHVLEHVNDKIALREIWRILRPGGKLVAMIPIVEGWSKTYENSIITKEADREKHFGQADHIRYYGADFRNRVKDSGYFLREITAEGPCCVRHYLIRGEKIFVAEKKIA